jgi:hypothetical protein
MISFFAPMLDESSQLILDVFGLLSRQPRHGIVAMITLAGQTVAGLAIGDLGLKVIGVADNRRRSRPHEQRYAQC